MWFVQHLSSSSYQYMETQVIHTHNIIQFLLLLTTNLFLNFTNDYFFVHFWNVFAIPLLLPPIPNHSCRGALKASHLITIYFSFLFLTIDRLTLDNNLTNLLILFKHLHKGKQRQCKYMKINLHVLTQNENTRD